MRRFTSMKVGLASILSCLALFLGLFATTGTASAHTAGPQVDPHIRIAFVFNRGVDCTSFLLVGRGFFPDDQVRLLAESSNGFGVSISPHRIFANGAGDISSDVTVCGNFARFRTCGTFIDNPSFFCGFNLNPEDFCRFRFEPGEFCFSGPGFPPPLHRFCQPFPGVTCPQPLHRFLGCGQFRCGFHPIRVVDFCRFQSFSFCSRFSRNLTTFITAEDLHTGELSNTVAIRTFRGF